MRRLILLILAAVVCAQGADMALQPRDCAQNARARIGSILVSNQTRSQVVIDGVAAMVSQWSLAPMDGATFGLYQNMTADNLVSTTAGSATISSTNQRWSAADVGKKIDITGAGVAGGTLSASIASFVNAGQVTLSKVAVTTVTASLSSPGGLAVWGKDSNLSFNTSSTVSSDGSTRIHNASIQTDSGLVPVSLSLKLDNIRTLEDLGAIGDGTWHPLSEKFATLAAAQAVYPHVANLNQSIDWAAIQAAANAGGTWYVKNRYNVTNPIAVIKNGTRFIGVQGAGDPDSTSSPISRFIVTYWRGLQDGGVYDALLTLRNPLGTANDTIQGCSFEFIYFDPGYAAKDAVILEQCYSNQFTSCWFGGVQCTLATNGAGIRFKKYSGTNRFQNCFTASVKAVVFEEYDVNTYHLYNTFTNFRVFGGVFGVDMRAGCIGNTFTNLMCDLTSLSTFAAYGGTIPGVAAKSDVRGIRIHPDGEFGAYPGNTFNSITNADFENTENQGTALDYVGNQCFVSNFSVSAGYATQIAATATGLRIRASDIWNGQHVRPAGCERWLNGFFEGASEDSSMSWAFNWRSNAITRDNTYKQFTFPWMKSVDANAKIDTISYFISSDIATVGHKVEILSLTQSGTSPTVVWTSGDLSTSPGIQTVTPSLSLANVGQHYYIRVSIKGTGGTFLYLHPLRVVHTGIGE